MIKGKNNLHIKKCYKCKKNENILRWIMFYGKPNFICEKCDKFKPSLSGIFESYWMPSDEIH